jgi:hypothetical protein
MATIADFRKAIEITKRIGSDTEREGGTMRFLVARSTAKLALDASHAWTVREAFVSLFAANPSFDATEFRNECGPVAKRHYGEK